MTHNMELRYLQCSLRCYLSYQFLNKANLYLYYFLFFLYYLVYLRGNWYFGKKGEAQTCQTSPDH